MTELSFVKLGADDKIGGPGGDATRRGSGHSGTGSTQHRVTIPAASAEWSFTIPKAGEQLGGIEGPAWIRFLGAFGVLTITGSGGNQYVGVELRDENGIKFYEFQPSYTWTTANQVCNTQFGITKPILRPGWTLTCITPGMPAHNWSDLNLHLEAWSVEPVYDPWGPVVQ